MITLLIFSILLVIGIVWGVIYEKKYLGEAHLIGSVTIGAIGALGVLVSVIIMIIMNCPTHNQKVRIYCQETINELTTTRQMIREIKDDYARSVAITQYNSKVQEFKTEVATNQNYLNNPFINWYVPHAYNEFSVNAIEYITSFN